MKRRYNEPTGEEPPSKKGSGGDGGVPKVQDALSYLELVKVCMRVCVFFACECESIWSLRVCMYVCMYVRVCVCMFVCVCM
jgi:hypothetical protein